MFSFHSILDITLRIGSRKGPSLLSVATLLGAHIYPTMQLGRTTIKGHIVADNPAQVDKAMASPKLAGWFVGQVMKATGGRANPMAVNEIVQARLGL